MEPSLVYKHRLKDKMRDRGYSEAVWSIVRSVIVGLSVFAVFVVVCYVLLALPGLKSSSLTRFKRLKETALTKACVPPSEQQQTQVIIEMCETPHGMLRCNNTLLETISHHSSVDKVVCDEETIYYRSIDVEYEARVEALLRLVHLEAKICGPVCVSRIEVVTDAVTNHPPLSVCLLTLALMVIEWSVMDCHRGRKRVRAASDVLATKPPSFLNETTKQD